MLSIITNTLRDSTTLLNLTSHNSINQLSRHTLVILTSLNTEAIQTWLGQYIEYQLLYHDQHVSFGGYIISIEQLSTTPLTPTRYRLITCCWLGLLQYEQLQRQWHNNSAVTIINRICQKHGFPIPKQLFHQRETLIDHAVQWKSTTQQFIQEILAKQQLHFFFKQNIMHLIRKNTDGPMYGELPLLLVEPQTLGLWHQTDFKTQPPGILFYANCPTLYPGQQIRINKTTYWIQRVTLMAQMKPQQFCQSLLLFPISHALPQLNSKASKPNGLFRAMISQINPTRCHYCWNTEKQLFEPDGLLPENTKMQFTPSPKNEVLIKNHHWQSPMIIGTLYSFNQRPPAHLGFISPQQQSWQVLNASEKQYSTGKLIHSGNTLQISANECHMTSPQSLTLNAKTIHLKANAHIQFQAGNSFLSITDDKITLNSPHIKLA